MLRLTVTLSLLALPVAMTRLLCFHQRLRPPAFIASVHSVVIAQFPIAWFFGFLYYTDVPSLLLVVAAFAAATEGAHWTAALVGLFLPSHRVRSWTSLPRK